MNRTGSGGPSRRSASLGEQRPARGTNQNRRNHTAPAPETPDVVSIYSSAAIIAIAALQQGNPVYISLIRNIEQIPLCGVGSQGPTALAVWHPAQDVAELGPVVMCGVLTK